ADGDDLAVGLKDRIMDIVELAEVRRIDTSGIEGRVEAAIFVVAHQYKVEVAAASGSVPGGDDFVAVRLSSRHNNHRVGGGIEISQPGGDDAVGAERRIEAAVGVVSHQREV